jgi:hypothetical protein
LLFSVNFGEVYPFYTWPNYFTKFEVTSTIDVNVRVTKVKGSRRPLSPTFNSSNPPDLHYAYFSGLYEASFTERRNDRPIYYEQGQEALGKDVTAGMFYYCEKENAWVFRSRPWVRQGLSRKKRCNPGVSLDG